MVVVMSTAKKSIVEIVPHLRRWIRSLGPSPRTGGPRIVLSA